MRKWDGILAVVAVISVAIYSLACRPAWNPDGKSVAFPFAIEVETDAGAKTVSGIALYDVESGAVRRVYEEEGEDFGMSHVLWREDGKSLVAVAPRDDKAYRVMLVGLDGKAETIAILPGVAAGTPTAPVLDGDALLVGPLSRKNGNEAIFSAVVNLDNWRVEELWPSTESALCAYRTAKGDGFYLRVPNDQEDAPAAFGQFVEGKQKDLYIFPKGEIPGGGCMAPSPDGAQFAVIFNPKDERPGDSFTVRILDASGKVVKDIVLDTQDTPSISWLGDSLWIGLKFGPVDENAQGEALGFLVMSPSSDRKQVVRLFEAEGGNDDEALLRLQPTISPDGKTVAVTGFSMPGPDGSPTALVLLDAAAPEKNPKYIPLPLKDGERLRPKEPPSTESSLTPATK